MSKMMSTILYVDDEPINLKLFTFHFRKKYNVLTSESPLEALQIVKDSGKDIDLVVTDYNMPDLNGFELIKAIKKQFPKKICIMVTGYLVDEILPETGVEKLVHSFVLKPYDKEDLSKTLEMAINNA